MGKEKQRQGFAARLFLCRYGAEGFENRLGRDGVVRTTILRFIARRTVREKTDYITSSLVCSWQPNSIRLLAIICFSTSYALLCSRGRALLFLQCHVKQNKILISRASWHGASASDACAQSFPLFSVRVSSLFPCFPAESYTFSKPAVQAYFWQANAKYFAKCVGRYLGFSKQEECWADI